MAEDKSDRSGVPGVALEDGLEDLVEARKMEFVGEGLGLRGLVNTFRIGDRWADIALLAALSLDVGKEQRLFAEVLSVHTGELGEMLELHSGLNHGCRQPMPADRRAELRGILEGVYGRKLADSEKCVVVYMYVHEEEEAI